MTTSGLVENWAQWMLHSGWQAAVVGVTAMCVLALAGRRLSPQLRFWVLYVALLKFAMPPFLMGSGVLLETTGVFASADWQSVSSFSTEILQSEVADVDSLPSSSHQDVINSSGDTPLVSPSDKVESPGTPLEQAGHIAGTTANESLPRWLILLAIGYVCGVLASILAAARQFLNVRRIIQRACCADQVTQQRASILCQQLKMKLPRVLVSDDGNSPFASGVLRPVVVLPRAMLNVLDPDQLEIVLAHELVHIRRRDLLTGWLEVILTIVWWFHPVIWWLRSGLRRTREECCDDALVSRNLAQPVRYCETLIRVARCQVACIAEPVALGFARGEHPAANRIRRLMDNTLLRRDRLRVSAIVILILLALVILPGIKSEESPVTRTQLDGPFGWKSLPFTIDDEEETRVEELRQIAQSFFHTSDDVRQFDESSTRDQLGAILKQQPGFFYTQHLLGVWHLRNGDPEKGQQLVDEALRMAPVVLSRRYRFGNGNPLQNTEIQRTTIECNRVQNGSLNPELNLMYPSLVTDRDGRIRIPVYNTVFRVGQHQWPEGYHVEDTETLGWFQSNSHIGVLPDLLVWVPYSRPQDFTRTAAETKLLKDAVGTRTGEITSGSNAYVLASVARANRDATFTIENGRGTPVANAARQLSALKNAAWMDHAVIDLKVPDPERFEIHRTIILDSRTRLPLQTFQSGAGIRVFDNQRFHLYSLWNTLPKSVDLVLQVHNYDDAFRLIVPAREGAAVQHNGTTLTIPHLIAGQHQGWSSASGYVGEPMDVNTSCEVELNFTGNTDQKFSVWVALKNGDRWNMKPGGWFSSHMTGGSERLSVPLKQIDHFELRPYAEPTTIFFEDIRLPVRHGELSNDVPHVEFPVHQLEQEFTSDLLSPMNIHFVSHRGRVFSGIGSSEFAVSLQERDQRHQEPDTNSTIVWWTDGRIEWQSKAEFVLHPDADIDPKRSRGSSTYSSTSDRTSLTAHSRGIPLEAVEAVHLELSPKHLD